MSEIKTVNVKITNLDALKSAASALGGTVSVAENFKAYRPNQKCDYKIQLGIGGYEVGVRREKDGTLSLHYDDYDRLIERAFGKGLQKLSQQYSKYNTLSAFRKAGFLVREVAGVGGKVRLEAQRI